MRHNFSITLAFATSTLVALASTCMLLSQDSPPRVSYSRQIEPILAMHCMSCHGGGWGSDSSGLDLRAYAGLMIGGNRGRSVTPHDPDQSILVQFIEHRRFEKNSGGPDNGMRPQMPFMGRPLSKQDIALIRQWIAEGANPDDLGTDKSAMTIPSIMIDKTRTTYIACRPSTSSYISVKVSDVESKRILFQESGAVRPGTATQYGTYSQDLGDIAYTGNWAIWELRPEADWPSDVRIELTIAYYDASPVNTLFIVTADPRAGQATIDQTFFPDFNHTSVTPNPASFSKDKEVSFLFNLVEDANVQLTVSGERATTTLYEHREGNLGRGGHTFKWQIPRAAILPGNYVGRLNCNPKGGGHQLDLVVLFRIDRP